MASQLLAFKYIYLCEILIIRYQTQIPLSADSAVSTRSYFTNFNNFVSL